MCMFAIAPLFNCSLTAEAYLLRRQSLKAPLLPALAGAEIHIFTSNKPLFIPLTDEELGDDLLAKCGEPRQIIPLLVSREESDNLARLREKGYSFAVRGPEGAFPAGTSHCMLEDWVGATLPQRRTWIRELHGQKVGFVHPVARGITQWPEVKEAIGENISFFEGSFYFKPELPDPQAVDSGKADATISPLKSNLIQLINTVRDENCDFEAISNLVRQDPALTVSLMRLVNSPFIGVRNRVKSIPQAVTLLGQVEVRKWIATAVFKFMGADRPDELTRGSLLRAKFSENLAPQFHQETASDSLFLLGLFSALDGILGIPMRKALGMVPMDGLLFSALLDKAGPYAPILRFFLAYESADWTTVDEICQEYKLDSKQVLQAYVDALAWYDDLQE